MAVVLLKFESEREWLQAKKQDVTSTEVAALFGLHPYLSRLKLWHRKNGTDPLEEDDIDAMDDNVYAELGRLLQNPVGQYICKKNGWDGYDLTGYYYRDEELKLACSLDLEARDRAAKRILMEIKIAEEFRAEDGWTADATPLQYEFQVHTQFHLDHKFHAQHGTKAFDEGIIGTLGRRQKIRQYPRVYVPDTGKMIEDEVFSFWESIKAGNPPPADYAADAELLAKLAKPVRMGEGCNLSLNNRAMEVMGRWGTIEAEAKPIREKLKELEREKDAIKAEIHATMGDAETAIIGEYIVSAKKQTVEEKVVHEYDFRRFDVKKRKGK